MPLMPVNLDDKAFWSGEDGKVGTITVDEILRDITTSYDGRFRSLLATQIIGVVQLPRFSDQTAAANKICSAGLSQYRFP
jgi:hypothetical protein